MTPIKQLMNAVMRAGEGDEAAKDKMNKMLTTLEVKLTSEDRELPAGKQFMKRIMQKWINAADTLLTMICTHLPSPVKAQKYRVGSLYSGPEDDEAAKAVMACDPEGPLMMYISKMFPSAQGGRFIAYGRVFSGTVAT